MRYWRTEVPTEIVMSENGLSDLSRLLGERKKVPFFIIDNAVELKNFDNFCSVGEKFLFDATASEPRTGDVDAIVKAIRDKKTAPDVIVGIGGGSTIDLAKAVGICIANPKTAAEYQGWGLDMAAGIDCWAVPTLAGTGAELTPIAVLRGPEKKLGINTPLVAPKCAIIDPLLTAGVSKFNRFFTMMDCYFHHYEITKSKTSELNAILDASDGLALSRAVLSRDLSHFDIETARESARASILGGSSTIGGRVGAAHAISYGLSNASPKLPHSVAVTISMLGLEELYTDGGYKETLNFMARNEISPPRAREWGIDESHIAKMTKTALGMDKLWLSHFGEGFEKVVTQEFIERIYAGIVA